MVDADTAFLTAISPPDNPTLQIPVVPGYSLRPRATHNGVPRWDATDEIFITYDTEGNRAGVTTGEHDVWDIEYAYQRDGAGSYEQLASLRGQNTQVLPDHHRDHPGQGPRRRPAGSHRSRGGGATQTQGDTRHRTSRRRVPERSDQGIRSHRHCPGCTGHDRVYQGARSLLARFAIAWVYGWFAIWGSGVGISFLQYVILSLSLIVVAATLRPVWREWANAEDRHANGGRR